MGSAESPTADFLLDWLKSSCSDPRRYVASLSCRPQMRTQPSLLCFYGRSPSLTVPAACTGPTCQNIRRSQKYWRPSIFSPIPVKTPKILSRLQSVLSLSRKFVYDHCCCPRSAIILTSSKMEAILDFWRGCQDLSQIQLGGGGREGEEMTRRPAALLIAFEGESERGGGREGEEQTCPCTKCTHMHVSRYEKSSTGTKQPGFNKYIHTKRTVSYKGTVSRDFLLLVFIMNQFPV